MHARRSRLERALQGQAHVAAWLRSLPRIFLETHTQHLTHSRGHIPWNGVPRRVHLHNCRQRVGDILSGKRPLPRQHLIQHRAERPDVGALVHDLAPRLLGTHVRRRSENHARIRCRHAGHRR